jgi:tryptophan synthase alpha chain
MKQLALHKEKALVCFLTAGFPTLDATVPLVRAVEKGGADIIELGMPFSDPIADGPVIQHSSQIALQQGMTLDTILSNVQSIRRQSDIPLVLMGYLNPIVAYGAEKFFTAAAFTGVDGIILPELPFEESGRYKEILESNNLANILLVTPTTPPGRIALIDQASRGFLYCVSTTGVTGASKKSISDRYLRAVKKSAKKNPVLVGFGITSSNDAHRIARAADGVIVGSALIRMIRGKKYLKPLEAFVRQMKMALHS